MIVVSFTSWKARITNCKRVVKSILDNTVKPDRVYLNLSREEFKDTPLPKDLLEFFEKDDRLIINWCEGNDRQFKKVFPILKFLNSEDIVIATDDDILFPVDFIESKLDEFKRNGCIHPITASLKKCHLGDTYVVSTPFICKAKMLGNYDRFVDETVMKTGNDDRTYLYMFWLNGYTTVPTARWTKRGLDKNFSINPNRPLKGSYIIGSGYDDIVSNKVRSLTGKDISFSFNYFKDERIPSAVDGRHDIVIPYCHRGIASVRMTVGEHMELEYVVASMYRYCSKWMGRIFIVGDEPPEGIRDKVVHIPCNDPYIHCKDANIIHKILHAINTIPDLSDDFIKASDDQIVTRETTIDDFTPRIVRRYTDWTESRWLKNSKMDFWHKCLLLTLRRFDLKSASFWEPHIWAPFNKYKYREMCERFDWKKSIACIDNSLYYNFIGQPVVEQYDHLHINNRNASTVIATMDIGKLPTHLTWTDIAFKSEKFRDILNRICYD